MLQTWSETQIPRTDDKEKKKGEKTKKKKKKKKKDPLQFLQNLILGMRRVAVIGSAVAFSGFGLFAAAQRRGALMLFVVFSVSVSKKYSQSFNEPELKFGLASIQGRRDYQEDRFVASSEHGTFAVFDGHGGALTSDTASKVFLDVVLQVLETKKARMMDNAGWLEAFQKTEEKYRVASQGLPDSNGSIRSQGREGATACAAMIRGDTLSVANAGDSRCVVCQKNGVAIPMSIDHKVQKR